MLPQRNIVVARTHAAVFARHRGTLVVFVTDQVSLPVRTCALATPHPSSRIVLNDDVLVVRPIDFRGADHLTERPFCLAAWAGTLDSTIARGAAAHVALIRNLVHVAIRARAPPRPHADIGAHLPIDDVPRLREVGVVCAPLLRIEQHVRTFSVGSWIHALKHAPQDVMTHAKPVIRYDHTILLNVHPADATRAKVIVQFALLAREMRPECLRATTIHGNKPRRGASGVATQLHGIAELLHVTHLPGIRGLPSRTRALACHDLC